MADISFDQILNAFRAAGEDTRLRLLAIIAQGELTVTELTQIVGQSQPRVSRHLKILTDAGLLERYREGAWMFYRLAHQAPHGEMIAAVLDKLTLNDKALTRDMEMLARVRTARNETAAAYFKKNAAQWDILRQLHLPESDIEQAMLDLVGPTPVTNFVDLGTGTGRMLIVFSDIYKTATGFDASRDMLSIARVRLDEAKNISAQVRHADLYSLPIDPLSADLVCLHQVLHFLPDPAKGFFSAAAVLRPGGRLIIADFSSHSHEFLRDNHAHRRLGFSDQELQSWCRMAGLTLVRTQTLSPGKGEAEKLTVKLWLCAKPSIAPSVPSKEKSKAQPNV